MSGLLDTPGLRTGGVLFVETVYQGLKQQLLRTVGCPFSTRKRKVHELIQLPPCVIQPQLRKDKLLFAGCNAILWAFSQRQDLVVQRIHAGQALFKFIIISHGKRLVLRGIAAHHHANNSLLSVHGQV